MKRHYSYWSLKEETTEVLFIINYYAFWNVNKTSDSGGLYLADKEQES